MCSVWPLKKKEKLPLNSSLTSEKPFFNSMNDITAILQFLKVEPLGNLQLSSSQHFVYNANLFCLFI